VVDLGSGAGYFALKMARRVGPDGRVFAVDLRRESLAFLWIRAWRDGLRQLQVIHGAVDDPSLPDSDVDAVLIANTFHELRAPAAILDHLWTRMRSGATLVVVDRGPRDDEPEQLSVSHHEITRIAAEDVISARGFVVVTYDDRFIDRPGDDIWWLLVSRKP
jgi:ubiquinone/menaquinone biosynthesis C-methylase UbiE